MEIEHLDPDSPETQALIALSDSCYVDMYPAESNHLETSEDLKKPNVLFLGGRIGTGLVASGAAKIMDDDGVYAEIKRVYVIDQQRGKGLSYVIMQALETELKSRGVNLFRLETGVRQPEAIGLYRKLGYHDRGPFGSYEIDPYSVFMEKNLDQEA
jgi:putative acetyltransferase